MDIKHKNDFLNFANNQSFLRRIEIGCYDEVLLLFRANSNFNKTI